MGGFIADIFGDVVLDGLVWGAGALILKMVRPGQPIDDTEAVMFGLVFWTLVVAALLAIGYWYLA